MPIAYLGMENKAWWVLEAANHLYLHSDFPSLTFVPIKLSPGVGVGAGGRECCVPQTWSWISGERCALLRCHQGLRAISGTTGNAPTQTINTTGTISKTQLVNSKC